MVVRAFFALIATQFVNTHEPLSNANLQFFLLTVTLLEGKDKDDYHVIYKQ